MRAAEEIRAFILGQLPFSLRRPYMSWGGEFQAMIYLEQLVFIDQKEELAEEKTRELASRGYCGSLGKMSFLIWHYRDQSPGRWMAEAASISTEIAHNLGYVQLDRVLTRAEWKQLRKGLRARIKGHDWNYNEVVETFGSPSALTLGSRSRTLCYTSEEIEEGWMFFDFQYDLDIMESATNPSLRNVRLPKMHLSRGLVSTRKGRALIPSS